MLAAASNTFPIAEMEGIIPRAENVFRVTCYLCLEVAILIPETETVLICRSTTNKRRMVWNWIEHNNLRFIACIFISNMQNFRLPNKIRRLYSRNMGAPASWWRQNRCQSYKDLDSFWCLTCDDKQDSLVLGPLTLILKSTFEAELQLLFVDKQLIIHFSPLMRQRPRLLLAVFGWWLTLLPMCHWLSTLEIAIEVELEVLNYNHHFY